MALSVTIFVSHTSKRYAIRSFYAIRYKCFRLITIFIQYLKTFVHWVFELRIFYHHGL